MRAVCAGSLARGEQDGGREHCVYTGLYERKSTRQMHVIFALLVAAVRLISRLARPVKRRACAVKRRERVR